MPAPPDPARKEQRLLRHARREALVIMAAFAAALAWTIAVGCIYGYQRDPDTITLIIGFPDWVFWGVVVPWAVCLVFSAWFCIGFMADDDLGRDNDERAGDG